MAAYTPAGGEYGNTLFVISRPSFRWARGTGSRRSSGTISTSLSRSWEALHSAISVVIARERVSLVVASKDTDL
ncbi:MAG: hypothetical protein V1932_04745 [Chloroflexota bacterium]